MPRPRLEGFVAGVERRRMCDEKKSITWAQGLRRGYFVVLMVARRKKTGTGLDAFQARRHLTRVRRWKEHVNTNGKNERRCDGRGASFIRLAQASKAGLTWSLQYTAAVCCNIMAYDLSIAPRKAPCASTHLQLVSHGHGQHRPPTTSTTLANNNIYPTRMALLVARTMRPPASTIAQISVLGVASAGTVPPGCSLVAL